VKFQITNPKKLPGDIENIEDSEQLINFAHMFWSRAAQALAPRVGYWDLRFIWNLVLGIWNFYMDLFKGCGLTGENISGII